MFTVFWENTELLRWLIRWSIERISSVQSFSASFCLEDSASGRSGKILVYCCGVFYKNYRVSSSSIVLFSSWLEVIPAARHFISCIRFNFAHCQTITLKSLCLSDNSRPGQFVPDNSPPVFGSGCCKLHIENKWFSLTTKFTTSRLKNNCICKHYKASFESSLFTEARFIDC